MAHLYKKTKIMERFVPVSLLEEGVGVGQRHGVCDTPIDMEWADQLDSFL